MRLFLGITCLCCFLISFNQVSAQSILVADLSTIPPNGVLSIDLQTCQSTVVASNLNIGNFTDIWMTSDGTLYLLGYGPYPGLIPTLYAHNTSTGVTTALQTFPASQWPCSIFGLSETSLLLNMVGNFYIYDIPQNTLTLIGNEPGFSGFLGEIYEYNGQLYVGGNYGGPIAQTYRITIGPPFSLTLSTLDGPVPAVSLCGKVFGTATGASAFAVHNFNAPPNSLNQSNWICLDDFNNSNFGSFAPDPFHTTGPLCDCSSESGSFTYNGLLSSCTLDPIPLPYNNDATLDPDDNLVFMIGTYDNLAFPDVVWVPLVIYEEPIATFVPGVTEVGVYYEVRAVAADAVGNTVDLSDPCAEVSWNHVIIWKESPTVTFAPQPDVCAGNCLQIQAAFTGAPPFTLTYKVTAGPSQQTFTQVFNSLSGNFQVCPPPGYVGALTVEATSIANEECTCD
jgi:hypothetical protein